MDWVVDAGNTRLRWAAVRGGRVVWQAGLGAPTPDGIRAAWAGARAPERVLVAAVGDNTIREAIARTAREAWGREPTFLVSPPTGWGVTNGYHDPARLGIDRFAALVAARRRFPAAALIVDVGTAMTIDILVEGAHRGGYILPGPELMARCLEAGTAELPSARPSAATAPATETSAAMGRGTGHALIGAVAEVRTHLAGQGLSGVPCILTGGGAALVRERIAPPREELPGLVLEGLARIAAEPMDSDACGSSF